MHATFYAFLFKSIKAYVIKKRQVRIRSLSDAPTIFVANHEQSFGPVSAMASLPQPLFPWVTHEITDKGLCPQYIESDFVRPEVHLRPPLSVVLSRIIGRICVALMRDLKAIPVYKASKRIAETIEISVRYLEQGRRLLIFPEIPNRIFNEFICEFDTGFVTIAKSLYERTRQIVTFLPVAVHRGAKSLHLGSPVYFDPFNSFRKEKARIKQELIDQISAMYREMEPHPAEEEAALSVR